ncbi:MAG: potassium transporter TrkG [Eubacterium sp.]|nr:potassium transporter TrkG [Eubacterium sp.]
MTFNHKLIVRTISTLLMLESVAMIPSFLCAAMEHDWTSLKAFVISMGILSALSIIGLRGTKKQLRCGVKTRESYFFVFICWITVIVGGILPYLFAGRGFRTVDAIFESVASWTTSSSWVIDINLMPRAILLWKATSSWLGGMGIILLAIIVMSSLGASGKKLALAELPGPDLMQGGARIMETASLSYGIYTGITIIELICLMLGRVPFFDALVNSMTSICTAGILDYHGAVELYFTPYVKVIIVIFSIISSLNFLVYINIYQGRAKHLIRDIETKTFLITIGVSTAFIAAVLFLTKSSDGIKGALTESLYGVVSFACTSGFPFSNIAAWPTACKVVLVALCLIGGCANSTCGGIKVIRFVVFIKLIGRGVYKRIHPRSVKAITIQEKPVSANKASIISTFILLFVAVYLLSALVLSLENMDIETTLTAPIALFTNTGVGFGKVVQADYRMFSSVGKLVCSVIMLLGRLEMYAILIMFSRSFWNSDKAR